MGQPLPRLHNDAYPCNPVSRKGTKRARPVVLNYLELSITKNETPCKCLAGWPRCIPEPERSTGNPQHSAGTLRQSYKKNGVRHNRPEPRSRLVSDYTGAAP